MPTVLSGFPAHVWYSLAFAMGVGITALVISNLKEKSTFGYELLRDIGIAFVVAAVVSGMYEFSTRSITERETLIKTINRAMSVVTPESVWAEVTDQILHRPAVRRNVQIEIRLSRDAALPNGKTIHMPADQAILWMSYSYDLYSLLAGGARVSVEHELDYQMWNRELQLPRFSRVIVANQNTRETRTYEGDRLQAIYRGKGVVVLDGNDIVDLPPPRWAKPIRITTERYELVNTPGTYNLVMQELAAPAGREPTAVVTITRVPGDVDVNVYTYYPPHTFTKRGTNTWVLNSVLLPGQEFTVLFARRPQDQAALPGS